MKTLGATLTAVLLTVSLHAQTIEQITFARITETPMSVRSAAMGGALDAATDDISSLDSNPAAASSLKRFTISGSAANLSFDTQLVQTDPNLFYTTNETMSSTSLAHFAAAVPLRNFVFGAYYHREPDIRGPQPFTPLHPVLVPYESNACESCLYLFPARSAPFSQRDSRYGVTGSWRAGNFAIGAGAELRDLDRRHEIARTLIRANEPGFQEERLSRELSGTAIVPSAGIVWRAVPALTLAASYAGGGSFDRTTSVCGVAEGESVACRTEQLELESSTIDMPDSYRAGASFRATDRLVIAAEAVRRNYSSLADEPYSLIGSVERLPIVDVTELHTGAEYTFGTRTPIAIRAGWWRDPARSSPLAERTPSAVAGETDENHITLGAGLHLGDARLDISFDRADDRGSRRAAVALTHSF